MIKLKSERMMGSLDAVLNLPAGRQVYRFVTGLKKRSVLFAGYTRIMFYSILVYHTGVAKYCALDSPETRCYKGPCVHANRGIGFALCSA